MDLPLVAGSISTVIFAASMLPMLLKAARTQDLGSYSLGNVALINLGNVVHTMYVVTLPPGPVWVLHSFYVVSSALMLLWCLRYRRGTEASGYWVSTWGPLTGNTTRVRQVLGSGSDSGPAS